MGDFNPPSAGEIAWGVAEDNRRQLEAFRRWADAVDTYLTKLEERVKQLESEIKRLGELL
jgi:hypothetical protein